MYSVLKPLNYICCVLLFTGCTLPLYSQVGAAPPEINYISVINAEGDVYISWSPSPTPGVYGYVISEFIGNIGGAYQARELVTVPDTTSWILHGIRSDSAVSFFIKVEDGQQYSSYHTKMCLEVDHRQCRITDTLKWTPYAGWENAQITYRVWVNDVIIAETNNTSYVFSDIDQDQQYTYKIEALKEGDTISSFSNWIDINTQMAKAPDYINADYATVLDNNSISLSFSIDTSAEIHSYTLSRSGIKDGDYIEIQKFELSPGEPGISFQDPDADIHQINFYVLSAINSCNNVAEESNKASNIVLTVMQDNRTVSLKWNEYYDWRGGVSNYIINRKTSNDLDWQQIQVYNTTYIDNLPEFSGTNMVIADACYYVEAYEGTMTPYGSFTSSSNSICIQVVELPNAFSPNGDGMNDFFPPQIDIDYSNYKFIVYDKWGMKIFETDNASERWDGKGTNGKYVPEGVYSYYLEVTPPGGNKIQVQKQLTVVYP